MDSERHCFTLKDVVYNIYYFRYLKTQIVSVVQFYQFDSNINLKQNRCGTLWRCELQIGFGMKWKYLSVAHVELDFHEMKICEEIVILKFEPKCWQGDNILNECQLHLFMALASSVYYGYECQDVELE